MMPDLERVAKDYKDRRSVRIGEVDCDSTRSLCSKYGVSGFPSLKVFKFRSGGNKNGEDFNGGRDYNSIKRYVDKNLAGPECGLEDKEGCTPHERALLEESEKMSTKDRNAKMDSMKADLKAKQDELKALQNKAKQMEKDMETIKAGGMKPDRLIQLIDDDEFRAHCETRTCIMAFLPHILDDGAKKRNEHLKIIESVFKKAKGNGQPVGFMWLQGGDQFEMEEKLSLQFGFPAVIAINLKKERYGVHRGTLDEAGLSGFLSSMMVGRVSLSPLPKGIKWSKSKPWDGKDAAPPSEEM